jgi:hypothetical protein
LNAGLEFAERAGLRVFTRLGRILTHLPEGRSGENQLAEPAGAAGSSSVCDSPNFFIL